ncbi:hypothetical protein, partial [Bradyrhizobium sp.]|uniref:hypothetical protein n=1 Tax=Bradyrhizobium sp. TaxID=376 RepID=UPI0025C0F7B2
SRAIAGHIRHRNQPPGSISRTLCERFFYALKSQSEASLSARHNISSFIWRSYSVSFERISTSSTKFMSRLQHCSANLLVWSLEQTNLNDLASSIVTSPPSAARSSASFNSSIPFVIGTISWD